VSTATLVRPLRQASGPTRRSWKRTRFVAKHMIPARRDGQNGHAMVVLATGTVSGLNYLYTLMMIWLLKPTEYVVVGSISAVLLIWGTVAGASVPWVLAREVVSSPDDPERRQRAVCFSVAATFAQALGAGIATCVVALEYAAPATLAVAFASVVTIFCGSTAAGYLQGYLRFRRLALLRIAEVIVKIGSGVGLVLLGQGATGAVAGFAAGAAVVAAVGAFAMRRDFRWVRGALWDRRLWASAGGLLSIQGGVAVMASLDVVLASIVVGKNAHLATYQAANVLGRVPLFIGASVSLVVFPLLARRRPNRVVETRESLRLFVRVCIPATGVAISAPALLVAHLFPASYGDVGAILPWAALAGLTLGLVNLTTTYFQAAGLIRRTSVILAVGICAGGVLDYLGLRAAGNRGLAAAVAIQAAAVSFVLLRDVARRWPGSLRSLVRSTAVAVALVVPLWLARRDLILWAVLVVVCALAPALLALWQAGLHSRPEDSKPRVTHLGYEDPRRPGAGGGSVRTREISRRLANDFDITVVCARFHGCRPRREDGVHYVHIGIAGGYAANILSYFAMVPYALARYPADLVIEDFGAPFSSIAVPWMTKRPVIGIVQWLFAKQKRGEYGLPFDVVEKIGVRSHRRLIAVSDDLATELRQRNQRASVAVVLNGLGVTGSPAASPSPRKGFFYLGRLESAQKGLDLLLPAYALIADQVDHDLIIGGDGPDREKLQKLAAELGVGGRTHFVGRVVAADRFSWLARAHLLAMPSRYETFGMVAAEALSVATPVVAFGIPCLRGLVTERTGIVVPPYDVKRFAAALLTLATNPGLTRQLGEAGPAVVAGLNWDLLSAQQGSLYHSALLGETFGEGVTPGVTLAGDR
jgi:glycosyltransferase involved in cell wall biosynthesis/O-antigen/teichoic acid export membrane protein